MSNSLKGHLIRGSAWVLLGKVLTVASTLTIHAVLTRLLAPETYGVYVLAFSLVTVASMVAQLGMHQAVVRLVAESLGSEREGRARGSVVFAYRYTALGVILVCAALLAGPGAWLAERIWSSTVLAGIMGAISAWVAVNSFQVLTSESFRGFKDLRLATIFGGVITGLLGAAALGALWLAGASLTLGQAIWITVGSASFSLLLGLTVLAKRVGTLKAAAAPPRAEVLAISLPLWIAGLTAFVLAKSDLWILAAFRDEREIAMYGNASLVVGLVSMSLILVNLVVPPFIAEMYGKGDRQRLQRLLRNAAALAGLPAFLILLVFVFAGGELLGLVFGEFYRAGGPVLALLSLGKLFNVFTGSCGVTMSMTGHQRILMRITVITTLITVAAALLAVRPYGSIGVASAVCAGTIFQNLAMWLATRYYAGLWTHVGLPTREEVNSLFKRPPGSTQVPPPDP